MYEGSVVSKPDIGFQDSDILKYKEKRIYNQYIKLPLDFIVAILLLLWLAPLFILIGILVHLDSPGPILYKGVRSGIGGKKFRILKFRTMVQNAEKVGGGTTALNDSRITRVGSFLRKCKLDEMPQLINIIKGEMSFIEPRPELVRYTDKYVGIEKIILNVRPGITDISSIKFISLDEIVGNMDADSVYEQKVLKQKNLLRIEYVLKQSLLLDCSLFIRTVGQVVAKTLNVIFRRKMEAADGVHKT